MKDFDVNKLWVSMGEHDTGVLDTNEKFIQAEKIIIHHNYEPRNSQHNDIGNLFNQANVYILLDVSTQL